MLKVKKITHVYEMKVFTDAGEYFGDVEECILTMNKIFGWRVRATRNSSLHKLLGGAKGVIVPHRLVRAIGDIMIISKSAIPAGAEGEDAAVNRSESDSGMNMAEA
ncbi:PRC-barrel domain-containing protein [Candidatus Woesearchaeota archaeon]|nr:PRC-barrel domain-containing protein [Candidatus Woesearchaeota archaeon]